MMDKKFKKNFLKGSAAATIGTVVSMGFHFISIMMLTRSLTKEEFGIYILILVVVHLFNLLSGFGLELTLVRKIASNNRKEKEEVLFPVVLLRSAQLLFITLLFYLLSGLLLPLLDEILVKFVPLIAALFAITNFRDLFYNLLQGLNYFRRFAIVQSVSAAVRVVLIAAALYFDSLDLLLLIYIEIATTGLAFVMQLFLIPLKNLWTFTKEKALFKSIIKFSFPLYLNNLLTFTYDRVHLFIIAAYLSPVSVALYDVAYKIPEAAKRIFSSFIIVYFPNLSRLFTAGNKEEGEKLMNNSLLFLSIIITFGVLISFLFAEDIILMLFSEKYVESSLAFSLLMLNFLLRALANILGYTLVSAGYSDVPVKVNSLTSIVSIAGSLLLIPLYGYIGVIYALLVMNIVSIIFYHFYLVKGNIIPSTKKYLRPIIIFATLFSVYYLIGISGLLIKLVYAASYIALGRLFIKEFKDMLNVALVKLQAYYK